MQKSTAIKKMHQAFLDRSSRLLECQTGFSINAKQMQTALLRCSTDYTHMDVHVRVQNNSHAKVRKQQAARLLASIPYGKNTPASNC